MENQFLLYWGRSMEEWLVSNVRVCFFWAGIRTGVEPRADSHHVGLVAEDLDVSLVLDRGQVLRPGTGPGIPGDYRCLSASNSGVFE